MQQAATVVSMVSLQAKDIPFHQLGKMSKVRLLHNENLTLSFLNSAHHPAYCLDPDMIIIIHGNCVLELLIRIPILHEYIGWEIQEEYKGYLNTRKDNVT